MKKTIFYFFLLILLLPIIQMKWNIVNPKKLNGFFVSAKDVSFTLDSWFSANFQSSKEKYIKENIGFRSYFILTYNQMMYSLYNKAVNPGGVVGKDNYLYLESYIFNETGENYIGDKQVNIVSQRLLFLQQYFAKQGVKLLTVFLPSKASYFPEYIPSKYKLFPKSNYTAYCENFESLNINYIDLNTYFLEFKEKAPYPVFPKNGVHWTDYGMAIAMDSLINKIEEMQGLEMPHFSWEEPVELMEPHDPSDIDAENLMNLIYDLPREKMPYPNFLFENDSTKKRTKTIVISDSYYAKAYERHIPQHIFEKGVYWYYFNTARYSDGDKEIEVAVEEFNLRNKLFKQDVIVLFASQATLHLFPYGFDETMFNLLLPDDKVAFKKYLKAELFKDSIKYLGLLKTTIDSQIFIDEVVNNQLELDAMEFLKLSNPAQKEINKLKYKIRGDKNWYQSIVKKAEKNDVPIEEMLQIDAESLYYSNNPEQKKINEIKKSIRADKAWYRSVVKKAKERNISVEEMLQIDATWLFNQNDPVQKEINKIKRNIKSDKRWYQSVVEKAKKRDISVEKMLQQDATWFYNQKKKKEEAKKN